MARVTVEDCVGKVPNRFELVLYAAHRAREISSGAPLTVDRDNDKNPVVALREIADDAVTKEDLYENLIKGLQRHNEIDEPEDHIPELESALAAELGDQPATSGQLAEQEEIAARHEAAKE